MLLVIGSFRIAPDHLEQARPTMQAMIDASRAEAGCLFYHYAMDLADPGLVHVQEGWRDDAALADHFQSPHLQQWRASWPELGISDRQLLRYDVAEAQPC